MLRDDCLDKTNGSSRRMADKRTDPDERKDVATLAGQVREELRRLNTRLDRLDAAPVLSSGSKLLLDDLEQPLDTLEREVDALRLASCSRFETAELRAALLAADNDTLGGQLHSLQEQSAAMAAESREQKKRQEVPSSSAPTRVERREVRRAQRREQQREGNRVRASTCASNDGGLTSLV